MNKEMISTMRVMTVVRMNDNLTDENLVKAMTINEELNTLGYTLKPEGIIMLAKSDMSNIVNDFKSIIGKVSAKSMYPNFPTQVMDMDEAEFRFHQMFHYFSTYGIEDLFGKEVQKGWRPSVEDTEKVKEDTSLLKLKVLDVIFEDEMANFCINKLADKRERFTIEEKMIFEKAVARADKETLLSMNMAFKENLIPIFKAIFESKRADKQEILVSICQHTGDIWKCVDLLLMEYKHFKTSQKRILVKVLESFPVDDFKSNLIISNSKARDVKHMLQYIDYNIYSRSSEHKLAVAQLRNKELKSWEGQAKALISEKNVDALKFIAKRPGMMIRMLTLLLRAGYTEEMIQKELVKKADSLSTQTLVTILEHFGRTDATNFAKELHDKVEAEHVFNIVKNTLAENLKSKDTEIKNKKVYLSLDDFNLELSQLECNNKSPESGYLTSGLALNIPEDVKKMRFFVYWNDKRRVDIDLHTYGLTKDGERFHIGWNADFYNSGMVTSGDITHSDAAEFIDIDLETAELKRVNADIDIYSIGDYDIDKAMKNIETVFVGMMAVDKIGKDVKLYDPKNCFFTHYLKGNESHLNYGIIDLEHRVLIFKGIENGYDLAYSLENKFNLKVYLEDLFAAQNVEIVDEKENADFVISMEKTKEENGISLIDQNFYLD